MSRGEDTPGSGKKPWRRPQVQGLATDGPPVCNPAFPQATVCASQGLVQSAVGCNQPGIFS